MLTMYSTTWCGYCHRLKSQLDREGIAYDVVDIEQDAAAAEYVMSVNGGNQTVPTVRFADGSALTNPTIVEVLNHLDSICARSDDGRTRGGPAITASRSRRLLQPYALALSRDRLGRDHRRRMRGQAAADPQVPG